VDDEYRLNIYIRIMRLLLEEDDAVTAESFFNRASLLIHNTKNRELQRTCTHVHALLSALSI
jgi:COP9 signalosome complex subunit 4